MTRKELFLPQGVQVQKPELDRDDVCKLLGFFSLFVQQDTRSEENAKTTPSTPGQREFAQMLSEILRNLGLTGIEISETGYLTACLPANTDASIPTIAFLAHLDTYHGLPGKAMPQIINEYDGKDIVLLGDPNKMICVADNPLLSTLLGQTIITSDGTTLLGADDKAGITEIITALNWLKKHPEIQHGKILVGFFPDEEITGQAKHLDLEKFRADFGYTVDGGAPGELTIETFHAEKMTITFTGNDAHPGACGKDLINAIHLAAEFLQGIPVCLRPESARNRDGFAYAGSISGSPKEATVTLFLRDFEAKNVAALAQKLKKQAEISVKFDHPGAKVEVKVEFQYPNYVEELKKRPEVIALAEEAMRLCGMEPRHASARGGTDGSSLTFRGLPCPDIFSGAQNFHQYTEWVALPHMVQAVETIIAIIGLAAEKA